LVVWRRNFFTMNIYHLDMARRDPKSMNGLTFELQLHRLPSACRLHRCRAWLYAQTSLRSNPLSHNANRVDYLAKWADPSEGYPFASSKKWIIQRRAVVLTPVSPHRYYDASIPFLIAIYTRKAARRRRVYY
jgi:hypothetical protein